jgi:hypothetical protein
MRDRLSYFVRNLDWKFVLAVLALLIVVWLARRYV